MADVSGPFTILQLFDHDLPRLYRPRDSKYVSLRHDESAAEAPVLPRVLICEGIKPLLDIAEEVLRRDDLKSRPRLNFPFSTSTSMYTMGSQMDVATTSVVFMLGYIYEILCIIYPKQWVHHSEATPSVLVEEDGTSDQDRTNTSSAENLQWNVRFSAVDSQGKEDKTIAILEMKRPEMIRYSDYEMGMIANNATLAAIEAAKAASADAPSLMYNAKAYTAQLSDSAREHKCPHAAIFNWDNLLLHVFDVDSDDTSSTASDQAGFIWAYEAGEGGAFMEKCPLRKAMLGWLLRAFQDHFGPLSAM